MSTLQTQVNTNTTAITTINTNMLAIGGDVGILNSYNLGNVVTNTSGITNTSGATNIVTLNITNSLNLTGSNGIKLNSTTTLSPTTLSYIDTTSSIQGLIDNIHTNAFNMQTQITANTDSIARGLLPKAKAGFPTSG